VRGFHRKGGEGKVGAPDINSELRTKCAFAAFTPTSAECDLRTSRNSKFFSVAWHLLLAHGQHAIETGVGSTIIQLTKMEFCQCSEGLPAT
jgi:hypothetical protein